MDEGGEGTSSTTMMARFKRMHGRGIPTQRRACCTAAERHAQKACAGAPAAAACCAAPLPTTGWAARGRSRGSPGPPGRGWHPSSQTPWTCAAGGRRGRQMQSPTVAAGTAANLWRGAASAGQPGPLCRQGATMCASGPLPLVGPAAVAHQLTRRTATRGRLRWDRRWLAPSRRRSLGQPRRCRTPQMSLHLRRVPATCGDGGRGGLAGLAGGQCQIFGTHRSSSRLQHHANGALPLCHMGAIWHGTHVEARAGRPEHGRA